MITTNTRGGGRGTTRGGREDHPRGKGRKEEDWPAKRVRRRACFGRHQLYLRVFRSSKSSVNSTVRTGEAAVRQESAETQEYESCQQKDMKVDTSENKEELSFVPSAVSDSPGWHEPRFMCDRTCRKGGFKFHDIAAMSVEDDGRLHTINLCKDCYNLRMERARGSLQQREDHHR